MANDKKLVIDDTRAYTKNTNKGTKSTYKFVGKSDDKSSKKPDGKTNRQQNIKSNNESDNKSKYSPSRNSDIKQQDRKKEIKQNKDFSNRSSSRESSQNNHFKQKNQPNTNSIRDIEEKELLYDFDYDLDDEVPSSSTQKKPDEKIVQKQKENAEDSHKQKAVISNKEKQESVDIKKQYNQSKPYGNQNFENKSQKGLGIEEAVFIMNFLKSHDDEDIDAFIKTLDDDSIKAVRAFSKIIDNDKKNKSLKDPKSINNKAVSYQDNALDINAKDKRSKTKDSKSKKTNQKKKARNQKATSTILKYMCERIIIRKSKKINKNTASILELEKKIKDLKKNNKKKKDRNTRKIIFKSAFAEDPDKYRKEKITEINMMENNIDKRIQNMIKRMKKIENQNQWHEIDRIEAQEGLSVNKKLLESIEASSAKAKDA